MDRLGNLKERKRNLLIEKDKIINEKPSKFKKFMYILGIGATGMLSSVVFLESTPSLIFCFTYFYTIMVPMVYNRIRSNKLDSICDSLLNIQSEIDLLENIDINRIQMKNEFELCREYSKKYVTKNTVLDDGYYEEDSMEEGPKLRLKM